MYSTLFLEYLLLHYCLISGYVELYTYEGTSADIQPLREKTLQSPTTGEAKGYSPLVIVMPIANLTRYVSRCF